MSKFDTKFLENVKDLKLEKSTLTAYGKRLDGTWRPTSIPLDPILANYSGVFKWAYRGFGSPTLIKNAKVNDKGILTAQLKTSPDFWQANVPVDLSTNMVVADGILKAINLPMAIAIPQGDHDRLKVFMNQLSDALDKNIDMTVSYADEQDGKTLFYLNRGTKDVNGTFFRTFAHQARDQVIKISKDIGRTLSQENIGKFTNNPAYKTSAQTDGTAIGFPVFLADDTSIGFITLDGNEYDLELGVGSERIVDFKNGSLAGLHGRVNGGHCEPCAPAIIIGRKVGVSAFADHFAIDFARFFDEWM